MIPALTDPSNPSAVEVIRELVALEAAHALGLIQYERLVSARQFVGLFTMVQAHVSPNSRVLDWGCGNGHLAYALHRMGHRTTAFSLEPAPAIACLTPDVDWVTEYAGGPERLPFDDGHFDAVLSCGVLEHVRETGGTEAASLREIGRVLAPGGVFLCYHFPNQYSYIDLAAHLVPGAHRHTYRYVRRDVAALCAASGLELVYSERYGALPRNPWQGLPRWVADSGTVAEVWDALDAALEWPLSPVVQNYRFVARKPARERQPS